MYSFNGWSFYLYNATSSQVPHLFFNHIIRNDKPMALAGQQGQKILVEQKKKKGQPLVDTISCLTL